MSEHFDPYHRWLGIPPTDQPPTHYRLLGLAELEDDAEVIRDAAERQMGHVRHYQLGPHAALSQQILNELAAAKACLLDPGKKAEYDERRRAAAAAPPPAETAGAAEAAEAAAAPEPAAAAPAMPDLGSIIDEAELKPRRPASSRSRQKRQPPWMLYAVGGGVAVVLLVVGLIAFLVSPSGKGGGPDAAVLTDLNARDVRAGDEVRVKAVLKGQRAGQAGLCYALEPGLPVAARIDPKTGEFAWPVAPDQPPGDYTVTIHVAEEAEGKPLSSTSFVVRVLPALSPPAKPAVAPLVSAPAAAPGDITATKPSPPGPKEAAPEAHTGDGGVSPKPVVATPAPKPAAPPYRQAGAQLSAVVGKQVAFDASVEDPRQWKGTLHYSLGPGAPPGAGVDAETGTFTWTPGENPGPGKYDVAVVVQGADGQSAQTSLNITVTKPATPAAPATEPGESSASKEPAKPKAHPGGKRAPVPAEEAQARAQAAMSEALGKESDATPAGARAATAAHLIVLARKEEDPSAKRYVLLATAKDLALKQAECLLALLAVDELARSFEVPAVDAKLEVLEAVEPQARTPCAVATLMEAALGEAEEAIQDGQYDKLLPLLKHLAPVVKKNVSPGLLHSMQEKQEILDAQQAWWQAAQTAAATLKASPDDPGGNLALGRFCCLVQHDWDKGLPLLAKSEKGPLAPLAKRVAANADDIAAQLALAAAFWDLAESSATKAGPAALYRDAANHWFEKSAPQLGDGDLSKAQHDLLGRDSSARSKAFYIPLHGVGQLAGMSPQKSVGPGLSAPPRPVTPGTSVRRPVAVGAAAPKPVGSVHAAGGFATFEGGCSLEYEQVPASSYIHEIALTFQRPRGQLEMDYGDRPEGARITAVWDSAREAYYCSVFGYRTAWTGVTHTFASNTQVRFTFYVDENRQCLYSGDTRLFATSGPPTDLHFRIATGPDTGLVISHCEFRPWTPVDAKRMHATLPPPHVESDLQEAALRWHERNLGLADRAILKEPAPFLVPTTGTPMQWIAAGSFQHTRASRAISRYVPPLGETDPSEGPVNQPAQFQAEPSGAASATTIAIRHGFWMGRYELTQREWMMVVPPGSSSRTVEPSFLPIDGVSYEDAVKFCALLNQRETQARRIPRGYVYRLPTEAEWEYACRAGTHGDFGVEPSGFWHAGNSEGRLHTVGEGKPNAWGLYDMHGNVAEWCLDAWRPETTLLADKINDPFVAPKNKNESFVVRGGAFWNDPNECASGARESSRSVSGGHHGFRIVLAPVLP